MSGDKTMSFWNQRAKHIKWL